MTLADLRKKIAALLLDELKNGVEQWYYISIAADKFWGGYVLQGKGPTDAWKRLHGLVQVPEGHSTETHGPIAAEVMEKIPDSNRYRLLDREESVNLGK